VLVRLKAATRELHHSVENRVDIYSAVKDIEAYRRLLQQFLGFFQPLEGQLRTVPEIQVVIPDFEGRMRSRLLEADLAEVGLSGAEIRELPRCSNLPRTLDASHALGCLYVLEGSTLGGQVIAREIAIQNAEASRACRFFRSDDDHVGLRWKRFAAAVEAYGEDHPSRSDVICDSALETFRCLEGWIDHCRLEAARG
jgi:heme oxygenase